MVRLSFVTTVDRNPGDSFICAGLENLLRQVLPLYRPFYIDKHDERSLEPLWPLLSTQPPPVRRALKALLWVRNRDRSIFSRSDLVVQAGTPFYFILPDAQGSYDRPYTSVDDEWIGRIWRRDLLGRYPHCPVLNMAVGTCQPFHSDGSEFNGHEPLLDFVRESVRRSALTIVREPIASRLLTSLGLDHLCLPCSALFAADFHQVFRAEPRLVVMNYMPGGGHYDLGQGIDRQQWEERFLRIYRELSARERVVVACHSASEVRAIRGILPEAETFFSPDYRAYLRLFAHASLGVVNRVHAGVALAGLGIPSVVIGTDTRAKMANLLGLPVFFVGDAQPATILEHIRDFGARASWWRQHLEECKAHTCSAYVHALESTLRRCLPSELDRLAARPTDSDSVRAPS